MTQNLDEIWSGFIYVEIEYYAFIQGEIINNYEKTVGNFKKSSQKPQGQKKIKLMSEHLKVVLVQVSSTLRNGGATNGDWILKW